MLLETEKDKELQTVFSRAELVTADSVGISLVARLKGFTLKERIPGIDLMVSLCQKAEEKGWGIYLVGAKPGIAEQTAKKLLSKFPRLNFCGTAHGYFDGEEEKRVLSEIKNKRAQMIFVGLNIPFQEKWIYRNFQASRGICAMGVGGSFDVISGNLKRAPKWIQKIGLEWLFRLGQETWRWKRVIRLPLFFYKVLLDRSQ